MRTPSARFDIVTKNKQKTIKKDKKEISLSIGIKITQKVREISNSRVRGVTAAAGQIRSLLSRRLIRMLSTRHSY